MSTNIAAAIPASPSSGPEIYSRRNPAVLTVAHRGVWTRAPENSLAAIRASIALGVEIVEIDVQASCDGRLVIVHDETLDRTSTGSGTVAELTFEMIRAQRLHAAAGGLDAAVTDEKIPTLEEALEEARGRILVNLDTKYQRDLHQVVATVLRLNMQDNVIVKSDVDPASGRFPIMDADWFGKIPHMPMFRVSRGGFATDLKQIEALKAPMIEVKFDVLDDLIDGREELERQDIRLWINTLDVSHSLGFNDSWALRDPQAVWGVLLDAGVGAIQTDENAAFKRFLKSRGA